MFSSKFNNEIFQNFLQHFLIFPKYFNRKFRRSVKFLFVLAKTSAVFKCLVVYLLKKKRYDY